MSDASVMTGDQAENRGGGERGGCVCTLHMLLLLTTSYTGTLGGEVKCVEALKLILMLRFVTIIKGMIP